MKTVDLYGLGNGIIDVLLEVSDEEFASLGYEKGSMLLLDVEEQAALLKKFADREQKLVSGGSVANSVVLFSQLGGRSGFSCRLGDDDFGNHYREEFKSYGIDLPTPAQAGGISGTSAICITPDAERTMRTSLGVSGAFDKTDVHEELVKAARWIFIEGYLFCNPDAGQGAIEYVCQLAKQHGTKIALTLSDAFVVNEFRGAVEAAVKQADLLFANEVEAKALKQVEDAEDAFAALSAEIPHVVVTLGGKGCLVKSEGYSGHTAALSVEPVDLTGAGDAYAGSFLYGLVQGLPPEQIAEKANVVAAKVIQQVGARFTEDPKPFWSS